MAWSRSLQHPTDLPVIMMEIRPLGSDRCFAKSTWKLISQGTVFGHLSADNKKNLMRC